MTLSNKGFTLIELLVVLVIILILGAVTVPIMQRHLGGSRTPHTLVLYGNTGIAVDTIQVNYLPNGEEIFPVSGGKIVWKGSWREIKNMGIIRR
jgi:prepilin-type N-terminal cleavage/methylation domain-containing protein